MVQTIGGVEYELLELGGRCFLFKRKTTASLLVYLTWRHSIRRLLQDSEDWQNTSCGLRLCGVTTMTGTDMRLVVLSLLECRLGCAGFPQHFGCAEPED